MKKIYSAGDEIEANMLQSYLEEAGIPAYSQESGSGEYLKIVSGFSIYGRDIFVEDENEEEAKAIIEKVMAEVSKQDDTELLDTAKWYQKRAVLARIILGVAVASIAAVMILSYIF